MGMRRRKERRPLDVHDAFHVSKTKKARFNYALKNLHHPHVYVGKTNISPKSSAHVQLSFCSENSWKKLPLKK